MFSLRRKKNYAKCLNKKNCEKDRDLNYIQFCLSIGRFDLIDKFCHDNGYNSEDYK